MIIPFKYGKIVDEADFTDRREETKKLVNNFKALTNTAIISPRRWGKSSLVNKAINILSAQDRNTLYVRMNIFKCGNEQDFYESFAKAVIEGVSSSTETLLANACEFISRLLPKLVLTDPNGHYEIGFGVDVKHNPIGEDILDLPQQIALRKKKRIIVAIDEFQQIGEFSSSLRFQKILRSHWQEQTKVAYILYGSKMHMMMNIFGQYNSPFYKFGDMMFLPKISNEDWGEYIVKRFEETGKTIKKEVARLLAEKVENHPYYVQQLAQYSWLSSDSECTVQVVERALQGMIDSHNLQFMNLVDSLTQKQRNFLCAISDGVKSFSASENLQRYNLGTSGNIRIMKDALKKRDLIDTVGASIDIQDPLLKLWIHQEYNTIM